MDRKLEVRITQEMTTRVKCDQPYCDCYGHKPVCYTPFFQDCKKYEKGGQKQK